MRSYLGDNVFKIKKISDIYMKDYYLQNIIDNFWSEDSLESAWLNSLEFVIDEFKIGNINMLEFSLLVSFTEKVKRFYDIPSNKE